MLSAKKTESKNRARVRQASGDRLRTEQNRAGSRTVRLLSLGSHLRSEREGLAGDSVGSVRVEVLRAVIGPGRCTLAGEDGWRAILGRGSGARGVGVVEELGAVVDLGRCVRAGAEVRGAVAGEEEGHAGVVFPGRGVHAGVLVLGHSRRFRCEMVGSGLVFAVERAGRQLDGLNRVKRGVGRKLP